MLSPNLLKSKKKIYKQFSKFSDKSLLAQGGLVKYKWFSCTKYTRTTKKKMQMHQNTKLTLMLTHSALCLCEKLD